MTAYCKFCWYAVNHVCHRHWRGGEQVKATNIETVTGKIALADAVLEAVRQSKLLAVKRRRRRAKRKTRKAAPTGNQVRKARRKASTVPVAAVRANGPAAEQA